VNEIAPHAGQAIALLCAVTWAVAVILFKKSGESVHPIGLNLFKDVLAAALFLPTLWLVNESLLRDVPGGEYGLLLVSGALGIGVADTLFFMSLNAVGAGLISIIGCLYSPFIIALSMIWLDENLSWWQLIGASAIVAAVLIATRKNRSYPLDRKVLAKGLTFGVLAQAANACGIVMIKPLLDRSPLIWVTEVRLIGGVAVLLIVVLLHRSRRAILNSVRTRSSRVYTLVGSFVGGYLAMVTWLAGMKYTMASVAAALNQTSSIMTFILAAIFLKEPVTKYRVIGIVLAVVGVMMVTMG